MPKLGLIGEKLSHSFSKKYFNEKFEHLNLPEFTYQLFELNNITKIKGLIEENEDLIGINVTIPYKSEVLPFLDQIDDQAAKIGAVNTIKITNKKLIGYNTDYFGFKASLKNFIANTDLKALIFGTGGASKAVAQVLKDLNIDFQFVSTSNQKYLNYFQLTEKVIADHKLLINTTPIGMAPNNDQSLIPKMDAIGENHYCYDLIYNPSETKFLKYCRENGAKTKNGLEMLHLQAEKAWEIWNN